MENKNITFSRVELILGVTEAEEFTVKGDVSGTVWRLKKEVLPKASNPDDLERWSITDDSRVMSSEELLKLINQPGVIQSLDESKKNLIFCVVNGSVTGIMSQIIISMLLAGSSVLSLLFNMLAHMKMEVCTTMPLLSLLLGIALFGYNSYKLGAYITANEEALI